MSDGVTGPPSPEPLSTRESTSSTELSAALAKLPTLASPMAERDTIELKQSQVTAANVKEATARRELAEAQRAESARKKAAQKQRQEAKDLEAHCKMLRAQIKALQPKIKGLKAEADKDDDIAKRENSFLYDLEEEVEFKEAARKKLESKLEGLQHEKMPHEKMLHEKMLHGKMLHGKMLHEKMLHDQYPDPVIRKLVERMAENKGLAMIFENFFWHGGLTLEGLEILEAQLEDISAWIPTAQENGQGSEKNSSPDQDVEGVEEEHEDPREEDLEAGEDLSGDTGMGSEKKKEDNKGKPNFTVLRFNNSPMFIRWRTWCEENPVPNRPSSSGNSARPPPSQQTTAASSPPKASADEVIQMLATRVAANPAAVRMAIHIATSKTSKEQFKQLQGLMDELNGIIGRQQAEKEQGELSSRTENDCSSIQMLVTRVTADPAVVKLMIHVAPSKTSKEQLKQFQGLIDELNGIRRQQAEKEQGEPSSRTGNDCFPASNGSSTTTDPTQGPMEQVPDGDGDSDGAVGSKMAESAPEPAIGRKDISTKSETGAEVETDKREHNWLSALTEAELRNQLQVARAFLQGRQAQARHLNGGKRKRESEDD